MLNKVKWTNYLWMSLITFAYFMLEIFSIFTIEKFLFREGIGNYTSVQKWFHSLITAGLWGISIGLIVLHSYKHYNFPVKMRNVDKIYLKDWLIAFLCFAGCKVITFIDWHSLKIIGEF